MLNERNVEFVYREYTKEPLTTVELRSVLDKLGVSPREVLRSRDAKKHGLTGEESDEDLIERMSEFPRLLQRPILVDGDRAVVGRPVEQLLDLLPG